MSISEAIRNWFLEPVLQKLQQEETHMAEIDDRLAAIVAAVAQLSTDLTKAITDLKVGQPLTQAQKDAFDGILTSLGALDTQAKAE